MKVAICYDRVNKFGGAERVLQALNQIYPDAPLYTLVYDKDKAVWASGIKVIPTFLNKISFLRDKHELLAPIAPLAFETLNFDEFDVVISVTSSDAKAIITKSHTLHICYCLTPTRYFWSGAKEYDKDIKMKLLPHLIKKYLRTVDLLISKRPDEYIAISDIVKNRINQYYSRDADIIYPAIDDKFYTQTKPLPKSKRKFYLLVSRLVPYKKADLAIKAFNQLGEKLVVIGTGSEEEKLKKMAKSNIDFWGAVDDDKLIYAYKHAKALIFPQDEDFGLVPIEAQSSGTPVIALDSGGARETVVDGSTGVFFKQQTTKSLINAIKRFEKIKFSFDECKENAKKFSKSTFIREFSDKVNALSQKYYQSK